MNKRIKVIELFVYAVLTIIGIVLMITYHPEEKEINILPDFVVEEAAETASE